MTSRKWIPTAEQWTRYGARKMTDDEIVALKRKLKQLREGAKT